MGVVGGALLGLSFLDCKMAQGHWGGPGLEAWGWRQEQNLPQSGRVGAAKPSQAGGTPGGSWDRVTCELNGNEQDWHAATAPQDEGCVMTWNDWVCGTWAR